MARKSIVATAVILLFLFVVFGLPRLGAISDSETPEGGAFDTVFFYTPSEAVRKAGLYDLSQVKTAIVIHWTLDLAFPLAYGFMACSCWALGLKLLSGGGRTPRFRLLWLPLGALVFDLLENASVSILLASERGSMVSQLASVAASLGTALKWLFVLPAMAGAVILPLTGLLYTWRRHMITR